MGHTVHKMCNIVDMNGASMRLASRKAMDVFKGIAAVDQDNYPETSACPTAVPFQHVNYRLNPPVVPAVGATYVVNAPWVFTAVWKVRSAEHNPAQSHSPIWLDMHGPCAPHCADGSCLLG